MLCIFIFYSASREKDIFWPLACRDLLFPWTETGECLCSGSTALTTEPPCSPYLASVLLSLSALIYCINVTNIYFPHSFCKVVSFVELCANIKPSGSQHTIYPVQGCRTKNCHWRKFAGVIVLISTLLVKATHNALSFPKSHYEDYLWINSPLHMLSILWIKRSCSRGKPQPSNHFHEK